MRAQLTEYPPPRRLRIRTRCGSVDEFVARYARETDEDSIRLALNRTSDCGQRPFAIFLNNDQPVMWGIADLEMTTPGSAKLRFVRLGDEAVTVHEQLLAERFANEPTDCWSKLPLPPPPVTRVARREDVMRASTEPTTRRPPRRVRSRVRFVHALLIATIAFFGGSWVEHLGADNDVSASIDTAVEEVPAFRPVITPLEIPLDEATPAAVATDDERPATHRRRR